ncbi:hypothetical protein BASA81_000182 [Batrachochytrium salamandrivorans]|nr:hypothetical protein BASA81_000182 [Batrachochytrium salamandrivorans]
MLGSESDSYAPRKVAFDRPVSQVRASSKTSALLTLEEGEVWTCGYGKNHALGFPSAKDVNGARSGTIFWQQPRQEVVSERIWGRRRGQQWGVEHVGRNWQWENGQDGKTGGPEPVEHNCKVVSVARGRQHLVFADEQGAVYSCGSTQDGALGFSTTAASVAVPVKLYSWGRNRWGQLGLGGEGDVQRLPKLVSNLPEIKQVECGENFTACVTANGDLYVCGNAARGATWERDQPSRPTPPRFSEVGALPGPVAQVSCGGGHIACVLQDGRLFIWGRKLVLQVACGGDHTLVLVEEEES